jgi:hypothetical protein
MGKRTMTVVARNIGLTGAVFSLFWIGLNTATNNSSFVFLTESSDFGSGWTTPVKVLDLDATPAPPVSGQDTVDIGNFPSVGSNIDGSLGLIYNTWAAYYAPMLTCGAGAGGAGAGGGGGGGTGGGGTSGGGTVGGGTDTGNYRIYRAQVRHFRIGRFLMGTAPDALQDAFNTLEFDFLTERRKMYKRLEIDLRADATVAMDVITDQDGAALTAIYSPSMSTPNGRTAVLVPLPPGIRGRLLRVRLTSPAAARIYHIRVWARTVNDPQAAWQWEDFPLEASEVLPTWLDIMDQADATAANWQWVDLPLNDLVNSG